MKTMVNEFDSDDLNLISLAQEYSNDEKARELLERLRWPHGAICPHCKNTGNAPKGVYALTPRSTGKRPARKGLYFCGACRKQFTVTVGTVFEGSHKAEAITANGLGFEDALRKMLGTPRPRTKKSAKKSIKKSRREK